MKKRKKNLYIKKKAYFCNRYSKYSVCYRPLPYNILKRKINKIINNKKLLSRKKMKEMTNKNSMKAMYVAPMVEMMNARVERGFEASMNAGIEAPTGGPVYELD